MTNKELREAVFLALNDLVNDFVYFARLSDDLIPVGRLEEAVRAGVVSVDEMVQVFEEDLRSVLEEEE